MKKINKIKTLFFSLVLCGAFVLTSCEKGDTLHLEWLDKGETVYAGKVDSVAVHSGNKRVNIETNVTVNNLEKVMIYWNNYTDSASIPVNEVKGFFDVTIENMEEKSYVFNIVTVDIYGNRSLPFESVGEVYGDYYQSTLSNRRYKALKLVAGKVVLEFEPALERVLFAEVAYENTNDEAVSVKVLVEEESYTFADYKSGLKYRTAYKPDEMALDTFYTDYFSNFPSRLKIDKSDWSIVDYSDAHSLGGDHDPSNVIDDNPATSWHTLVDWGGGLDYPHHVTIDLGVPTVVSEMDLFNDIDDGRGWGPAKFEIHVSENGVDLTNLGEFDFDPFSTDAQNYKFDIAGPIRYLKFVATQPSPPMVNHEWGAEICILGEIDLFQ